MLRQRQLSFWDTFINRLPVVETIGGTNIHIFMVCVTYSFKWTNKALFFAWNLGKTY